MGRMCVHSLRCGRSLAKWRFVENERCRFMFSSSSWFVFYLFLYLQKCLFVCESIPRRDLSERESKASLIIKDMSQPVTLYARPLSFSKSFHLCVLQLNNGICLALNVLLDSLEFPALTNAPFSTISSDFASTADTLCSTLSSLTESRPLSRRER